MLQALDAHHKYLPETELNECVDDFLFYLKKRPNEGATAFTSRFKATLSRLETLVAADKAARKQSKARRRRRRAGEPRPPSTSSSSSSSSDISSGGPEPLTKERVEAQAAAAAAAAPKASAKTVGSFVGEQSPKKGKKAGSHGSAESGHGSHKTDEEKAQRIMLQQLGKLEVGHMKLKAIFCEVVLGHLYMKKYGLTREQRTTVVRATGGSSRFRAVERIMRASDFEDRRPRASVDKVPEPSRSCAGGWRREPVHVQPSLVPSDEEIHEADLEPEDDETAAELQEIFEAQKKAKANVKKFYRDYRTSRKKVKEIKKSRQRYMPVVAIPPDDPGPSRAQAAVPTFKYDCKGGKEDGRRKPSRPKKEEVNILSSQVLTEFAYMVSEAPDDLEIYLASVPCGSAVIDTLHLLRGGQDNGQQA